MTLRSDLETTEDDALAALQRTVHQHTAAAALNKVHPRIFSAAEIWVDLEIFKPLSSLSIYFISLPSPPFLLYSPFSPALSLPSLFFLHAPSSKPSYSYKSLPLVPSG